MDGGRAMNETERPEPAADERGKFEEVFGPLPPDCIRVGEGYAATQYSAWQCQTYIQNWNGWKARAALQAAAVEPEPGLSLDEMLDDVEAAFVSILWREDVGRHEVTMHGHSSAWFARGTGKTRTEALAAAVQQAKENGDG